MNKIIILLMLLLIPIVQADDVAIRTNYTLDIGAWQDGNETKFNISLKFEDDSANYVQNNLGSGTNVSREKDILFIRDLNCNETRDASLYNSCIGNLTDFHEIYNGESCKSELDDCNSGKSAVISGQEQCWNDYEEIVENIGNVSDFKAEAAEYREKYNNCQSSLVADDGDDLFGGGGWSTILWVIVIGLAIYAIYRFTQERKTKTPVHSNTGLENPVTPYNPRKDIKLQLRNAMAELKAQNTRKGETQDG